MKSGRDLHILLINHYAGSPEMGMEFRPYYLAREWIKQGHRVTIVAATYSHIRKVNRKQKRLIETENIDGIRYVWVRTGEYGGNGIGRIRNMLQFMYGLYRLQPAFRKESIDAVIASSTYPLDNYPAYNIARKNRARYVYEVHDLWPLSPQELGGFSKYHPFIVVMQMAENFAYRHVDKVVSILPCALPHMLEHGLAEKKFSHVPNGIYLPEVKNPEPLEEAVAQKIPQGKFLVGYCGTLGKANALDKLIETARLTEREYPDIFYVIMGQGPEKEKLLQRIDRYHLSNVLLLEAIPKRQVQSFLRMCAVITIIWNDTPLYRYGISPNKLFDYMYAARPVIQAVKAGNDIVKDSGCGKTCEASPEKIRDAILELREAGNQERAAMGENGRRYVMEHHEYSILAKRFISAIEN